MIAEPAMCDAVVRETFRSPGSEWRALPFWSWNDRLEPDEIRSQIGEMKRAGFGGFFIHARIGLVTPWLGEEWFACVAVAVDEARRQGLQAWLYDEDRDPSGRANGLIVRRDPRFGMRNLELQAKPGGGEFRFAVREQDGHVVQSRPLREGEQPGPEEELREICLYAAGIYLDTMDEEAVRTFIDICYEPYRQRFADEFGRTIPGVFTDEANAFIEWRVKTPERLPWTRRFPREFRARRGYDLLPHLPLLFSGHPCLSGLRHDYWRTVAELFSESYAKQIAEWCACNGLELTGHFLDSGEFAHEIPAGSIMPSLEYMQRPGIDILTQQTRETVTCKQASSIAHQMGRARTLSETYGAAGWQMTFEGQKSSSDWQAVLGISTRCQHLTPYSLRGVRKRDFPPAFFSCQPWWKYVRVAEDYFARLSVLVSAGAPVREVLLLHNISTAYADAPDWATRNEHGRRLAGVAEHLLALHYDFDLGDEVVLSRQGSVADGRLTVGRASYPVVVLPPSSTLFRSTVDLLRAFVSSGGRLIVVQRRPDRIEGVPAPELERTFAHQNVRSADLARDELEAALTWAQPRRVSVSDETGRQVPSVIYHERETGDTRYFLFANRDRQAGRNLCVTLPGEGTVEQWDLETGETYPVAARGTHGTTVVELNLAPTGSAALVLSGRPPQSQPPAGAALVREMTLGNVWRPRRTTANSLLLDHCQWRFDQTEWSGPMPVWRAQQQIRVAMGLIDISRTSIEQPWIRYARPGPVPPRRVELRFTFHVREAPALPVEVIVESAHLYDLALNREPVPNTSAGWWLAKGFDRVPLGRLKAGANELVLGCDYRDAPEYELEACYLNGDFGVCRETGEIVAEAESLRAGDWCLQGYPYYAGNLIYAQDVDLHFGPGERLVIGIGSHSAACLAVHVNRRLAGVRGWEPYEVDITDLVRPGSNRVELELCGSPRNLLGPHYTGESVPPWNGPSQFLAEPGPERTRDLVPYGLFGEAKVLVLRHPTRP